MSKEFPSKTKKGATILVETKTANGSLFNFATVEKISRKGVVETYIKGGFLFMVDHEKMLSGIRVMTILDPTLQAAAQTIAAQNKGKTFTDAQEVRDLIIAEAEKKSKKVA